MWRLIFFISLHWKQLDLKWTLHIRQASHMGYRKKLISNTDFKMHLPIITEASTTIHYAQKAVFLSDTSKTRNLISQIFRSDLIFRCAGIRWNHGKDARMTICWHWLRDMKRKIPCVYAPSDHFLSQILMPTWRSSIAIGFTSISTIKAYWEKH